MEDTICAISTCVGNSSINVIRISGKEAIDIVNNIFDKDILDKETHTITYGHIVDKKEIIDEVLVSIFRAPKTYTKENIVEINSHGGEACVNKIMELLILNNCRIAKKGEFTKRAFLNGRINLTEAEAVNDLINASTEIERKQAINGLNNKITKIIKKIKNELTFLIGNIEVNIDYPEYEDAEIITKEKIHKIIKKIQKEIEKLINTSEKGLIIKNGIKIAIIGKPNVGKSSLLNALLNEEKAIVTEIKGTTRDIVEGTLLIQGIKVKLLDTAGIRETKDKVEKIGVEKSINAIEEANLILFVLDETEFNKEDFEILKKIKNKNVLVVYNKSDINNKIKKELEEFDSIFVSALNKKNIEELKNMIVNILKLNEIDYDEIYLSNARQIALLKKCKKTGQNIEKAINSNMPIDIIEIDVKEMWNILNELLGETYNEEILDEIFSKFCLGK